MLAQHIVNGLTLGSLYALIATGYSLVFSMVGMINLAYGAVLTIGALLGYHVAIQSGFGHALGLIVAMLVCGVLGLLTDLTAVEPIRRQKLPIYFALLSTYGVNTFVQSVTENVTLKTWATEFKPFPAPVESRVLTLFGLQFTTFDLVVLAAVTVIMLVIDYYMKRTWGGRAVQATASQAEVAEIMGINTRNVIAYTFFASCALASVAGMMLGMYYGTVSSSLGTSPGTKGFIAALIGGRGQITGAVLGALILGLLESLAAGVIGSGYRDLVAFIALVLMFLIKPSGLLGGAGA